MLNGQPVDVITDIVVNFTLESVVSLDSSVSSLEFNYDSTILGDKHAVTTSSLGTLAVAGSQKVSALIRAQSGAIWASRRNSLFWCVHYVGMVDRRHD